MDKVEWICRANKNSNNQIVWKCLPKTQMREHFQDTIGLGSTVKLPGNNPLGILFPGDSGTVTQITGQNILVVNPQIPSLMYWYNISDFALPVVAPPPVIAPPPVVAPPPVIAPALDIAPATFIAPAPIIAPVVAPFDVTKMTGAQLWLDSKDQSTIALSGSNVSQWNDKSSNSNNFMVQANFNPPSYIDINSGVQFNPKQVMISSKPVTTNSNTNIFFVGNVFNNKDDFDYIVGFTQQDLSFRWNPRNGFGDNNGNDFSLDSGYIINGGTGTKDFSKRALVNFVVKSGGSGQLTLSTDKNFGGDRFFKGVMCEFIVFDTPLTPTQIQEIQGYLAWKWGLNATLPNNHPYFAKSP
jgi:hypothetical protein